MLERMPEDEIQQRMDDVRHKSEGTPRYVCVQAREGVVGLLQMEAAEKDSGKLTIRYRLARRD